jgi:hypothetical protein
MKLESLKHGAPLSAVLIQDAMNTAPPFATIDITGPFVLDRDQQLIARGPLRLRGVRRATENVSVGMTPSVGCVELPSSPAPGASVPALGHWHRLPATITLTHTHMFSKALLMLETLGLVARCPSEEQRLRTGLEDWDNEDFCFTMGPVMQVEIGGYLIARGVDFYSQTGTAIFVEKDAAAYLQQCSVRTAFCSVLGRHRAQLAMYDCLLAGVRDGGGINGGPDTDALCKSNRLIGVTRNKDEYDDEKQTVQPWRSTWTLLRSRKAMPSY